MVFALPEALGFHLRRKGGMVRSGTLGGGLLGLGVVIGLWKTEIEVSGKHDCPCPCDQFVSKPKAVRPLRHQ